MSFRKSGSYHNPDLQSLVPLTSSNPWNRTYGRVRRGDTIFVISGNMIFRNSRTETPSTSVTTHGALLLRPLPCHRFRQPLFPVTEYVSPDLLRSLQCRITGVRRDLQKVKQSPSYNCFHHYPPNKVPTIKVHRFI